MSRFRQDDVLQALQLRCADPPDYDQLDDTGLDYSLKLEHRDATPEGNPKAMRKWLVISSFLLTRHEPS